MAANHFLFFFSLVVLSMATIATADTSVDVKVKAKADATVAKISVEGSIFCLSGKISTPIKGATARISCKVNSKVGLPKVTAFTKVTPLTDVKGFFLITIPASLLPADLVHCKAFLNSSPLASCNVKAKINGGDLGAPLRFVRRLDPDITLLSVDTLFFLNATASVRI